MIIRQIINYTIPYSKCANKYDYDSNKLLTNNLVLDSDKQNMKDPHIIPHRKSQNLANHNSQQVSKSSINLYWPLFTIPSGDGKQRHHIFIIRITIYLLSALTNMKHAIFTTFRVHPIFFTSPKPQVIVMLNFW
jgi:hypothetical protein